ncbi:MAG: TetR/AcrR family transcriptional regulator [Spirochaetales bacterium]|nr:TetR/AcrR family transcriptional regulator [Spirochaetales bacterium]
MKKPFNAQKIRILETAFREWSKTQFTKTSLSAVAKELKLTKAALYRYFTSKDHLLNSMTEKSAHDMETALNEFIKSHGKDSLQKLIQHYYAFLFKFFQEHPYYCAFFHSYLMRTNPEHERQFLPLKQKIDRIFISALLNDGHTDDNECLEHSLRFIQLTGFFWLMQLFRNEQQTHQRFFDFSKQASQESIRQHIRKSQIYCLNGFTANLDYNEIDTAAIEKTSWIQPREMLKADRIFSAIEQVIAEEGYTNASVEKIATRIGINKSSLYFYFKNKNDMFFKTIKREQEHFIDLTNTRLQKMNSFSEKLYSFIITLTSYTVNNPGMITILNWARYQNVGIALPHRELHKIFSQFDFKTDALQHDSLSDSKQDFSTIIIFIFFQIMYKLQDLPIKGKSHNNYLPFTRQIFSLFCNGITGYISRNKKPLQQKGKAYVKQQ